MVFDIDIHVNLKWFCGIKLQLPLLATEYSKLGLVINCVKFNIYFSQETITDSHFWIF